METGVQHLLLISQSIIKNPEAWEIVIYVMKGTGVAGTIAGIKFTWDWVKKMNQIKETIPKIHEKLDAIYGKFIPNGGESFFDQLKEAKQISLENQSLIWGLISDSYEGVIITDLEGKWKKISRSFLRMVALGENDCKDDNWSMWLSEDCQREVLEQYESLIQHHRGGRIEATFKNNEKIVEVILSIEPMNSSFKITVKQV